MSGTEKPAQCCNGKLDSVSRARLLFFFFFFFVVVRVNVRSEFLHSAAATSTPKIKRIINPYSEFYFLDINNLNENDFRKGVGPRRVVCDKSLHVCSVCCEFSNVRPLLHMRAWVLCCDVCVGVCAMSCVKSVEQRKNFG